MILNISGMIYQCPYNIPPKNLSIPSIHLKQVTIVDQICVTTSGIY
ncbi:15311_t:CDS:2 [Cetraspora pellucida]|uniref:15311_t:CDS:1 n=1 Tax=Cetraspora pellucida TaxID=1433469 RepID=A0A9N8WGQ4_9GLOM|nr:15311_t:CDS:2 [Cetraspora pellucida]